MNLKSGFKSSEFWRGVFLYGLAFYAISKGYTASDVASFGSALSEQLAKFKEVFVVVAALAGPTLDNIFYTKKRTELKKEIGK